MGTPTEFRSISVFDLGRRGKAWLVRWRVDGKDHSRSYPVKARADRARRRLLDALDAGDVFDTRTGLPTSWAESEETVASYAVRWFARNAAHWAPNTQDMHRNSLQHVLVAACDATLDGDRLGDLRLWIADACSVQGAAEGTRSADWLSTHSLRLSEVTPQRLRDDILPTLNVNLDGSAAKSTTFNKRRTTLSALLGDAFADELIGSNPMAGLRRRTKAATSSGKVDVRTIPSPAEFRLFIQAVAAGAPSARRHVAYMAFTLYTGARPGEVSAVRVDDLELPDEGWGTAVLSGSHTEVSKRSGAAQSQRGLKARSSDETRVVPVPPPLVALLRSHVELFPPSADGLVFRDAKGGLLSVNQSRYVGAARERLGWIGNHPFAAVSHYTARHVFISALIRESVDLTEIARLCGNSPAVILSTYAGVFAGMRQETLPRIEAALR